MRDEIVERYLRFEHHFTIKVHQNQDLREDHIKGKELGREIGGHIRPETER